MTEGREFPHVLAPGFRLGGILDPDFPRSSSCRVPVLYGCARATYEVVFPRRYKDKLVIEINSYVKKAGMELNLVQCGRMIQPNDLATMLGRGVTLVEGQI